MSGEIVYHDGTILKAFCNNFKKLYANQLYYLRDFILEHRHETDRNGLWFKMERYFINGEFEEEIKPVLDDLKKDIRGGGIYLLKFVFKQKKWVEKRLV